jgi:hypothetical protein
VSYSSSVDHSLGSVQRAPRQFKSWLLVRLQLYAASALLSACLFLIVAISIAYPQAAWQMFTIGLPAAVWIAAAGMSLTRLVAKRHTRDDNNDQLKLRFSGSRIWLWASLLEFLHRLLER